MNSIKMQNKAEAEAIRKKATAAEKVWMTTTQEDIDSVDEDSVKSIQLEMLRFVLKSSKEVKTEITKREKNKAWLRIVILIIVLVSTCLSLIVGIKLIWADAIGEIDLQSEIFIAFFTAVIAQLVSLVIMFVKYTNDTQSLQMYETIMQKLLEYLTGSQPPQ